MIISKFTARLSFCALFSFLLFFCSATTAEAKDGFYFGGGAGLVKYESTLSEYSKYLPASTRDLVDKYDLDQYDAGWKVFAGYRFLEYFAVEGGYYKLGEISARISNQLTSDTLSGKIRNDLSGYAICGLAHLPLGPVSIFGKLGVLRWDMDKTITADIDAVLLGRQHEISSTSSSGTDIFFGAGIETAFAPHAGLRLEWERLKTDKTDTDFFSLSLVFMI